MYQAFLKQLFIYVFRQERVIEFFSSGDMTKLQTLYKTRGKIGKRAGAFCTVDDSTLLYVDVLQTPRKIRWVNCKISPPVGIADKLAIETQQDNIYSMCYVNDKGRKLLISADPVTEGKESLHAYNLETGVRVWSLTGKVGDLPHNMQPRRVCTDGQGHLFVSDQINGCVIMLSSGGFYLRTILKEGDHGIGKPDCLKWCIGCLVVSHGHAGKYQNIGIFKPLL